jgi:hypothetical protein
MTYLTFDNASFRLQAANADFEPNEVEETDELDVRQALLTMKLVVLSPVAMACYDNSRDQSRPP